MNAILVSFAVIFVAELGDKSQLMALTFATRYRTVPILIGITIATAVVHAVSVLLGAVLAVSLPTNALNIAAGLAFLGFAAWTLRGDTLSEDEAAITLASTHGAFAVWLGSTIGMVVADALAILVGRLLGRRLPERVITIFASVMFVIFGVVLLLEGFNVI